MPCSELRSLEAIGRSAYQIQRQRIVRGLECVSAYARPFLANELLGFIVVQARCQQCLNDDRSTSRFKERVIDGQARFFLGGDEGRSRRRDRLAKALAARPWPLAPMETNGMNTR